MYCLVTHLVLILIINLVSVVKRPPLPRLFTEEINFNFIPWRLSHFTGQSRLNGGEG
jgi:hypothetical protein